MDFVPDVLGKGFTCLTLPLPDDAGGAVEATLVRSTLGRRWWRRPRFDVLYVHGWSDYFFQTELAEFFGRLGGAFYALDLRRYGRSLRPGQTPGFVTDLSVYDQEIEAALAVMRAKRRRPLVLVGHSTGGLTLSLWASRHPGEAQALILNSPWLELQFGPVARAIVEPAFEMGARLRPFDLAVDVDLGFYGRTVCAHVEGEWDYNLEWRPLKGHRAPRAFLGAVVRAQRLVSRGLKIDIPTLVLLSGTSLLTPTWTEGMRGADTAIDVEAVAHRAPDLGSNVTIRRLNGALHDVVLSSRQVRDEAYTSIRTWLTKVEDLA